MSETSTTAMLVGTPDSPGVQSNAVTATVPRDEIEAAMRSEPPAELILEILRRTEEESDVERRTLSVAWTRGDLETLAHLPGSDAVTFYFDSVELERALEGEDVEGHGLREAAVVLSIAAAAAVGAGSAAAAVAPDAVSVSPAAEVAAVGHDEASLADRGIGVQTTAPGHDESTLTARGIEPATAAGPHDEASLAARGIEAEPLAAIHDESSLASRGIEPATIAASHDEASLTARGITSEPITVSDTGSGFDFPSVEPGTAAAITGGLAGAGLLIAAAAFATRRREVGHP
jgi:hypothetical protein